MNEKPCSNQEIHLLFEYGFELENYKTESSVICMTLYLERDVDQTDHIADVFGIENVGYGYDVVTTL